MSHYAIIKQSVIEKSPGYIEEIVNYYGSGLEILKCGDVDHCYSGAKYKNVIYNYPCFTVEYNILFEGKINLNEYNINDYVEINNNNYKIESIVKSVDNKITYTVSQPKVVKCENYDELMKECELKFDEYNTKQEEAIEYTSQRQEVEKESLWSKLLKLIK